MKQKWSKLLKQRHRNRQLRKKSKKRKINANNVAEKILVKKKWDEKKARLLSELETNDLKMKHINSSVNK